MGESVEAAYIAVERAFGEGRFEAALAQALGLLEQLEHGRSDQLDLRLQLLIGHIHGYGLQQVAEAAAAYTQVLERSTDPTLQALASQGLELCSAQEQEATAAQAPAPAAALPATPWLHQLAEPDQALEQIQAAWSTAIPSRHRSAAARIAAAASPATAAEWSTSAPLETQAPAPAEPKDEPATAAVPAPRLALDASQEPSPAMADAASTETIGDGPAFSAEDRADLARGWLLVNLSSQPQARP